MNTKEFLIKKEELEDKLLRTVNFDMQIHIEIATFINNMGENPYYWYILKDKKYNFIKSLTEVFLDNADSDRDSYVRLIRINCPEELKKEVMNKIHQSSNVAFLYAKYLK